MNKQLNLDEVNAKITALVTQPVPPDEPEGDIVDFDWSDTDAVVLQEQPATAIYWNPRGELVIRQRKWPDDDPFIFIGRANLADFIDRLTDIAGIPSVGGPPPKPAPIRD